MTYCVHPAITGANKRTSPEGYRDLWTEEGLLQQAESDFQQKLDSMKAQVSAC